MLTDLRFPDLRGESVDAQVAGLTDEMWKWLLGEKTYDVWHYQSDYPGGWKPETLQRAIDDFNLARIRQLAAAINALRSSDESETMTA